MSSLPIFLCVGLLLVAVLNPDFDERQANDLVEPYFFPLRVLLALWTGIGVILFAMMTARAKGPTSA